MCLLSQETHQGRDHQAQIVVLLPDSILENGLRTQLLFYGDLFYSLSPPSLNRKIKLLPLLVIDTWLLLDMLYFFMNSYGIVTAMDVEPILKTFRSGYFTTFILIQLNRVIYKYKYSIINVFFT